MIPKTLLYTFIRISAAPNPFLIQLPSHSVCTSPQAGSVKPRSVIIGVMLTQSSSNRVTLVEAVESNDGSLEIVPSQKSDDELMSGENLRNVEFESIDIGTHQIVNYIW